ncbi:response regulator [Bacillus alkalicellulosilyticus]|uniref:ATP-binding response regulator n=1 Tax=Alkalihalobacterium alkalicellulosilyticum TaxID=1912214 RepID=UPI0009988F26|nr:response regulator [Bacillus alkalicellulosilyticus]
MTIEKVNILLVDDRPENLIALEAVLTSEEYHLISANSGEEALRYVLQYDFAVILLDVQMPGLNGFETANIIKKRQVSSHIPIIFVTALSVANEHVAKGYSTGAVDYIFKPFNPDILKHKVQAFVEIYKKQKEIELERKKLEKQTIELQDSFNNLEEIIFDKTRELQIANQELQVSNERFSKFFHFSPTLKSIRSLKDNRYIDVNSAWVECTGYTLEELNNSSVNALELISASSLVQDKPLDLHDSLRSEKITFVTKAGKIREGLISTVAAIIDGESCIISVILDITEKVQLEKEITRLDRLNLVGEMAAGIAHEIRNPMTTVHGFLQLAKSENNLSGQSEYIDLMIDELQRANGIITEFLTLAKNKVNDKKDTNINDVIQAIYPLLRAEALMSDKMVQLKLEECPTISLDEKEIRQLILNIGLNGLEAMTNGVLTIGTTLEEEAVVLRINDQGPGIEKDVLENIGTPFFTTKEKGTGLGLAICYSIASRNSAIISIETSNKGTTFIIKFPLERETVHTEKKEAFSM